MRAWLPAALVAVLAAGACAPYPDRPSDSAAAPQDAPAPRPVPPAPEAAQIPETPAMLAQPRVELRPPSDTADAAVTVRPGRLRPRRVPPPPEAGGPVSVALLVPLSGENRQLGRALLNAATMALFDARQQDFTLRPYDTRGQPAAARRAARRAVAHGADLLLGPVFAGGVAAAAEPARAADVPLIAFSTDRTVAGDGVYVMGFLPRGQVERIASYALRQDLRRFAVLAPDTPYGLRVVSALQTKLRRGPGELVRLATFDPSLDKIRSRVRRFARYDARQQARQARRTALQARLKALQQGSAQAPPVAPPAAQPARERPPAAMSLAAIRGELLYLQGRDTAGPPPFDAVLLPAGGDRLLTVAPLLPFFDIDPRRIRLLGTGQWDDPQRGYEPALAGAWYPAAPPDRRARFVKRYRDLHKDSPPRLATLAYDAVALASFLARRSPDAPYRRAALERPAGFRGLDGLFRFRSDGTVQRRLAVFAIGESGDRVIDPAATSFAQPQVKRPPRVRVKRPPPPVS